MRKRTPQDETGEDQAIKNYYDAFAPFYDRFHDLIDYEAWAKTIQQQIDEFMPPPGRAARVGLSPFRPRRLLEVGCGTGALMKQLSNHPQQICVGMDISHPMLLQARAKLVRCGLMQGNVLALSVQSNIFEVVVGNFSLLNLYSPLGRGQMLAEIHRVLKGGGIFLTDFFTMQRYHQLQQEKATSETNPEFKIRQSLLPGQFALQRTLTLQNHIIKKRLFFLDPSQVKAQMAAANFEIVKMTPLVPDNFNRLMVIGRKP